jgi:hypothetical protein
MARKISNGRSSSAHVGFECGNNMIKSMATAANISAQLPRMYMGGHLTAATVQIEWSNGTKTLVTQTHVSIAVSRRLHTE